MPCLVGTARRFFPNPRVGNHAEELIQTWPRNCPWRAALRQAADDLTANVVVSRLPAVGIDQDVRINGDHLDEDGRL